MSLTKAVVANAYTAIRAAIPGATTTLRHNGNEYSGTRASQSYSDQYDGGGAIQGAAGSVRLLVSELSEPYPVAGDQITVLESASADYVAREILDIRYDQTGATMLVTYGERNG